MAESQKGASSVPESMKKSPVLVDDNGQDFFDAWKSTVGGKDVLNLNTEAVTRERKKAFDFGKLDDLELDAEFGKMASFKMDMSDLDFSSPQKKTEKSKERPGKETTPKKLEGRRDHFSFSFDFNELDAFDLDTNLLKREKKPRKSAESEMLDIFENDFKNSPKLGGMNCSSSKDLISSKVDTSNSRACASPADLEQCDVPHESPTSQQKQVTTAQGGKNETDHAEDKRGFQGEHPLTEGSKRPSAENLLQDFSVQSRDYSPKETIQQLQTAGPSSAIVDTNLGVEKDDISMRAKDPSQSGTYSPVKALDSKCLTKLCIESVITDNEPEKHQGDKRNVAHASVVFHEPPKMQKDVEDDSVGPVLHKTLPGMRRNEDKQRSSSKVLQSSLHGDSKSEQFTAMSHGSNGLQLLPQNKSQATGSRLTSSTTPNQLYAICNKKMETMNLHSANKKSEHSRDDEKGGNHDGGLLKSFNQNPKVGSMAAVIDKNHKDSNTLHGIQRPVSNTETTSITRVASAENCGVSLPNADKHCGLSNRSISSGIHRSVSNTETISITRVASAENCGVSLPNADKQCGLSNRNISRITKSNKSLSNFAMRETKSVGNSKGNMAQHLKASPVAAHSVTMEKCAAFSPPLKRKSIEGSHLDLLTSNSSKRILESSGERRKSLPISPGINGQVGPESENIGGLQEDTYLDQQNSWVDVHVEGTVMDLEIPISIENDGNIEKAEACTKDLENICNMLRRKHEEAKELLLRAIINNNSLLMLDHPMYEGKRFAANLLLKKCDT